MRQSASVSDEVVPPPSTKSSKVHRHSPPLGVSLGLAWTEMGNSQSLDEAENEQDDKEESRQSAVEYLPSAYHVSVLPGTTLLLALAEPWYASLADS
ncbi:hypothetical protein LZ30DRAFT_777870 [Colletotrichum cereale]|nr:hypothetical protein LZ30DRAFT_777870 [Colletotrichum cereale]